MTIKILFLAGSSRKKSSNKFVAQKAQQIAAKDNGVDATFIDLKDFEMPLYNGDLEAASGLPENALKLKKLFIEHDAIFISSPEYNSGYTPLLKNSLDWISRPSEENEIPLSAFRNKSAALVAISTGGLGGMRGLVQLRMMLGNMMVTVIPQQLAIPFSAKVLDDEGNFIDEQKEKALAGIVEALIAHTKKQAK
ncbi:MAG: FMN reductase [Thiotrichales bacterium]|nr:MAG: FMN reductase [Thiotrichales bacterium]